MTLSIMVLLLLCWASFMLNVIMLNAANKPWMLSVIMLKVVTPYFLHYSQILRCPILKVIGNIRRMWKNLPGTNTLAYFDPSRVTIKSLLMLSTGSCWNTTQESWAPVEDMKSGKCKWLQSGKSYLMGRLSTVDLLVLTSLDQLPFILYS